ncbi:DNA polymerase, partial [Facklamia sp. P9177]|uniref:DNA polymerase n=1 Tax=Facklamia sp. P9177 TaxID=3421945 RepID=UPI003D17A4CC
MLTEQTKTKIRRKVLKSGFKPLKIGIYKTEINKKFITKEIDDFKLYKRQTPLKDYLKNLTDYGLDYKKLVTKRPKSERCFFDKNNSKKTENRWQKSFLPPVKNFTIPVLSTFKGGVNVLYGTPVEEVDPGVTCIENGDLLPSISNFNKFESLRKIQGKKDSLVIGFDTEFYGEPRKLLSWQFSVVYGSDLYEYIFLKTSSKLLSLDLALSAIFSDLGLNSLRVHDYFKCKACVGFDSNGNALWEIFDKHSDVVHSSYRVHPLLNGDPLSQPIDTLHDYHEINKYCREDERDWTWFKPHYDFPKDSKIDVTLVCHAGKVDLSTLFFKHDYDNLLRYCSDVQGGTITLQPMIRMVKYRKTVRNGFYAFPVSLSIRDTMAQAPAGKKGLENLGNALGIPKLKIFGYISHMNKLLEINPRLYFEYSMRDSTVTALYVSALYGFNKQVAVSITSATSSVMKSYMMDVLDVDSTNDFNRKYRGIESVKKGKVRRSDGPGFLDASNFEPITRLAGEVQHYCSEAYHGGYNGSSLIGYFSDKTYDYDLQSAYPTAMALVPDIDWDSPVVNEIIREPLKLAHFAVFGRYNPILPLVGYIRFKFPDNVKFPCIPVDVEGNLVFPRSSDGMDGVYAMGPEIYLALKLGAEIFCERGFILSPLMTKNGESRSLAHAVHDLVRDRGFAKDQCGNKSLEDLILKTMVNSGYGKNAQNVVSKTTWSAYKEEMESLGCSSITNPFSAAMTTSI